MSVKMFSNGFLISGKTSYRIICLSLRIVADVDMRQAFMKNLITNLLILNLIWMISRNSIISDGHQENAYRKLKITVMHESIP